MTTQEIYRGRDRRSKAVPTSPCRLVVGPGSGNKGRQSGAARECGLFVRSYVSLRVPSIPASVAPPADPNADIVVAEWLCAYLSSLESQTPRFTA